VITLLAPSPAKAGAQLGDIDDGGSCPLLSVAQLGQQRVEHARMFKDRPGDDPTRYSSAGEGSKKSPTSTKRPTSTDRHNRPSPPPRINHKAPSPIACAASRAEGTGSPEGCE